MDEDSQFGGMLKWALSIVGLGAVASAFFLPHPYGIIVGLSILLLFLLCFGGYFVWQRRRARREREQFTTAIEAQTAAVPKAISDPNQRADLDRVRQKFQKGLQEFKSRGKDLYKLPWYVIIGESGSGKTEAIRHSSIDFPPGLQDELQGSGGTVNMDWWFTNESIILDTAGSMVFNEARPGETLEWREFLRLLKRARPHCPINALFLVLSVDSLIKDSADKIAQKASRLAQQLDLIQRTLDVRFPVYLVVTKCDLLTGFREFFDVNEPDFQYQMFGWSNPDPLDAHFRPDLVEQRMRELAARLRRRRMALIRETSGTGRLGGDTQQFFSSTYQLGRGPAASTRRLDEVDSLFALPESVLRLAPRLRRYLETIFVAGEWSAKPVFLRGIYFTSSMREGQALDEAIAQATGLSLDQLPGDRSLWEKNRAFFLRDLFKEKVFRESGLVTRATNTLKLLRQRQLAIFGSASAALLLVLILAGLAHRNLKRSVSDQVPYWQAGATNYANGVWSPAIVSLSPGEGFRFIYGGTNLVPGTEKLTLMKYHQELRKVADEPLDINWVFKPMAWLITGSVGERPKAQRLVFEASVLRPLIEGTRKKIQTQNPPPGDSAALSRHLDALVALVQFEADGIAGAKASFGARHLRSLLSYLIETNCVPDTNLVEVFAWTYDTRRGGKAGQWPPPSFLRGNDLAKNREISQGLERYQNACAYARTNINQQLKALNEFADRLKEYRAVESAWFTNTGSCADLAPAKADLDASWQVFEAAAKLGEESLTNLSSRYLGLKARAASAASVLQREIALIRDNLPGAQQRGGLLPDLLTRLEGIGVQAATNVTSDHQARSLWIGPLDDDYLARAPKTSKPAYQWRWELYTNACALASAPVKLEERDIGDGWKRFGSLNRMADESRTKLAAYNGPLASSASNACDRITAEAVQRLKTGYVSNYVNLVSNRLHQISQSQWRPETVTNFGSWLVRVQTDLEAGKTNGIPQDALEKTQRALAGSRSAMLASNIQYLHRTIGFPVVLDPGDTMSMKEVAGLKTLLQGLEKELQASVWQCNDPALGLLRANISRYASVVNGLIREDGGGAEWEFYSLPPDRENTDDYDLVKVFRVAHVTIGTESLAQDLSRETNYFGKGTADAAVRIAFAKLMSSPADTPGVDFGSWGLIRLISNAKAENRSEDGRRWRFRVTPMSQEVQRGSILFEARLLDNKLPQLPKKADWPSNR